jgi:hypothetical protein
MTEYPVEYSPSVKRPDSSVIQEIMEKIGAAQSTAR